MGTEVIPGPDFVPNKQFPTLTAENYKYYAGIVMSEVDFWGRVAVKFRTQEGRNTTRVDGEEHFVGGENKCELLTVRKCDNGEMITKTAQCSCKSLPSDVDELGLSVLCRPGQTCFTHSYRKAQESFCLQFKWCHKDGNTSGQHFLPPSDGVQLLNVSRQDECLCGFAASDSTYDGYDIICNEHAGVCSRDKDKDYQNAECRCNDNPTQLCQHKVGINS